MAGNFFRHGLITLQISALAANRNPDMPSLFTNPAPKRPAAASRRRHTVAVAYWAAANGGDQL